MVHSTTNLQQKDLLLKALISGKNQCIESDYAISPMANTIHKTNYKKHFSFYTIPNRDGSIRWMFPQHTQSPSFLIFYNVSGLKSSIYALVLKFIFLLRCQSLFFKQLHLYCNSKPEFLKLPNSINYSLFTGTKGPDRTVLIECTDDNQEQFIYKIPFGEAAIPQLQQEFISLSYLNKRDFQHLTLPTVQALPKSKGIKMPVIGKGGKRTNSFDTMHWKALEELYQTTSNSISLHKTVYWSKVTSDLSYLNHHQLKPALKKIHKLLLHVIKTIPLDKTISTSFCHGDFTPWNMYVDENKLALYDFEAASLGQPLLFDLFHFVMQNGILIKRSNYKEIYETILKQTNHEIGQTIIEEHQVDVALHFKLYLIAVVNKYLRTYNMQKNWHMQIEWLLNTWTIALENELITTAEQPFRNSFVNQLFENLNSKEYALLKFTGNSIQDISPHSDIDMFVNKQTAHNLFEWIEQFPSIQKHKITKYSFMWIVNLYFKDGSFLEIDLIFHLKWKNKTLYSERLLSHTKTLQSGLTVAGLKNNLLYCIQFYFLNKTGIPKAYINFFSNQKEIQSFELCQFINSTFNLNLLSIEALADYQPEIRTQILHKISKQPANSGIQYLKNSASYLKDSFIRKTANKGMLISFSGVDGAGKTTLLSSSKNILEQKFRKKTIVLRHRPSILPILSSFKYGKQKAEKIAAEKLPHSGQNKSSVASLIRFLYYYIDYLIGQVYIKFRYVNQGYIVLYDRYYFDFIADPKRSNLLLNPTLTKFLYKLVNKPQLNFFLYAPPSVIYQRKKELNPATIKRMTNKYLQLFQNFQQKKVKGKYICIENILKEKSERQIIQAFRMAI